MIDGAGWLIVILQIFFVDLLLGADNAIVIALACRRLPPEDKRRAIFVGAAGAIVLRLGMILFANALLGVPLVKLVGAWTLVVIALNLRKQNRDETPDSFAGGGAVSDFLSAAAVIMVADAAMSLDNVVALAAIAGGNVWLLAIGVLFSIPILAYGALILSEIVDHAPEILTVGAGFLGWIAGAMAASDPLVAGWLHANAPALAAFAPALVAAFVVIAGVEARPDERAVARTDGAPAPPSPRWSAPAPASTVPAARPAAFRQDRAPARALPSAAPASLEFAAPVETDDREGEADAMPAEDWSALAPVRQKPSVAPASAKMAAPLETDDPEGERSRGWSEERIVVAGFVVLAFLAGLIIFLATFFDSLT